MELYIHYTEKVGFSHQKQPKVNNIKKTTKSYRVSISTIKLVYLHLKDAFHNYNTIVFYIIKVLHELHHICNYSEKVFGFHPKQTHPICKGGS